MTSELSLTSYAYLPYRLQLTFLVEFFRIRPTPTIQQRSELKKWFWHTSFSGYFRISNYSFVRGVLAQIRDFAKGDLDDLVVDNPINYEHIVKEDFNLNKAASKAFALMLAHRKPKSLLDGAPVDTQTALAVTNRHEYHHIFPFNYLEKLGVDQQKINMQANYSMLNLDNNRKISNKKPSEYFTPLTMLLGSKLNEVLESNFITKEAHQACLEDNYDKFVKIRSQTLIDAIKDLAGTR